MHNYAFTKIKHVLGDAAQKKKKKVFLQAETQEQVHNVNITTSR